MTPEDCYTKSSSRILAVEDPAARHPNRILAAIEVRRNTSRPQTLRPTPTAFQIRNTREPARAVPLCPPARQRRYLRLQLDLPQQFEMLLQQRRPQCSIEALHADLEPPDCQTTNLPQMTIRREFHIMSQIPTDHILRFG